MNEAFAFLRRFFRSDRGTAAVEAAIVMPLAISLMVGGVEFGRILSGYATADKTMRAAARYLARVPASAVCDWGLDNARNLAVFGTIDPPEGAQPLLPGWTVGSVTLDASYPCGSADTVIELQTAVPFQVFMLDAIGLPNAWTLNVQHVENHIGS